jgi:hypothetical protein
MKMIATALILLSLSTPAFAVGNAAVKQAAEDLKNNDVRTVITAVTNTEGNPCMAEGKSYSVDLQVKKAVTKMNKRGEVTVGYKWETVKTVGVDLEGRIMEICLE